MERDLSEFQQRVRDGLLQGMDWLTEQRAVTAVSPRGFNPDARAVIMLGMSYNSPDSPVSEQTAHTPHGRIARYAWGKDYHNVIRPKLRQLVRALERLAGREVWARLFVDSGPLAERAFAREAGIGWIGKNTLLLNRKAGSWVFLAAIVTDAELPVSSPVPTNCGTCTRCIDACPADALATPYVLDATRCISYLTIENRGAIDPALREKIGNWVFGCDICQDVCPVNRHAFAASVPALAPRSPDIAMPELIPLLDLSEDTFNERFQGMAVRRAKRSGFVRNIAIALGNTGDSRAIPALARALRSDSDPLVRGHAAWALGRIGGEVALAALAEIEDADPFVQQEIEAACRAVHDPAGRR